MTVKKIYFPIFIFLLFYILILMSNDILTIENFLGALPIMHKKISVVESSLIFNLSILSK